MLQGLQEGSHRNSGWRWADNGPKTPLSPTLVSAFQAHPPEPLVTRKDFTHAHTDPNLPQSFPSSALSLLRTKAIVLLRTVCPSTCHSLPIPLESLPLPCNPWEGRDSNNYCSWLLFPLQPESPTLLPVVVCAWAPPPLVNTLQLSKVHSLHWRLRCGWMRDFLNTHLELQTFLWESSSIS